MKKIFILLSISFLAFSSSFAASTIIDECDDIVYTTEQGSGESVSTFNSTTKSQGSYSLDITYNFTTQDAWYKNAGVIKTFAAPIDISAMEYFTLDINIPTANASFMMTFNFVDEKGYVARFEDYHIFDSATTGFVTKSYNLSNFHKSQWVANGRACNMKKITKIQYRILNQANVTAGSLNFMIDNVKFYSSAGLIVETILEDFESYADDAALQASWASRFNGSTRTLVTSGAYAGNKCINLNANIFDAWYNYAAEKTFTSTQDFSTAKYFKVAVYGDSKLSSQDGIALLFLEDSSGNRVIAYGWLWAENPEWSVLFFPFQVDGIEKWTDANTKSMGGASCWIEDKYDTGSWNGDCNLTQISKIIISFETGKAGAVNDVNIKFDNIIVGYDTATPPAPSVKNYNVNAITSLTEPTIDGNVGSTEWNAAATPGCSGFVKHDANTVAASEDPVVKALFSYNYLYVLYQVTNNNFALDFSPTGGARDPSGTTFAGDDFEIFLAPGGNNASKYYHTTFFPNSADSICYIWDEFGDGTTGAPGQGATSWNGTGDSAAFSYDSVSKLLTIEYRIPWTAFNISGAAVSSHPSNGDEWGVQLGYINNNPSEAVNWEPDGTAGFAAGRPFGTWRFSGTPATPLAAKNWNLYE